MSVSETSSQDLPSPLMDFTPLVLARKYRPLTFKDMIGQDILVRVLTNGLVLNRLPTAFVLTGIRGVGKTTTARILARALNCEGADGQGGPTPDPCGVCGPCQAILKDCSVDVTEMDAASHTGVDDIREIIEGTRYRAVAARYKVYIIDEVHMLSKQAFNALLKTLEEPPPHVKFVLATTELRKIPDTVLSRCMKLPLRPIRLDLLKTHFMDICHREQYEIEEGALSLIARAADGSVRDGLSLLDQAMTLASRTATDEARVVTEKAVLEMLGLGDRRLLFALFKALIKGQSSESLTLFRNLQELGADPLMILQELLDLTHWATLDKCGTFQDFFPGLDTLLQKDLEELNAFLSLPLLSRCWQLLIKGRQTALSAPSPSQAVEMVLCQLCYMADLPTPESLIQTWMQQKEESEDRPMAAVIKPVSAIPATQNEEIISLLDTDQNQAMTNAVLSQSSTVQRTSAPLQALDLSKNIISPLAASSSTDFDPAPPTFEALLNLIRNKKEMILKDHLENNTHLISFEIGHLCLRFLPTVPKDTARRLRDLLVQWTGIPWQVTISTEAGNLTHRVQRDQVKAQQRQELRKDPLLESALSTFPGAQIDYLDDHTEP